MFWNNFYHSSEAFFLPDFHKHYYVFTDAEEIITDPNKRIIKVFQQKLGWPYDTLFRFKMFDSIRDLLLNHDYIFFLNANIRFLQTVGNEILPDNQERLMCVLHPGFYNKERKEFTYETDRESTAYIPANKGEHYFMGGFNGGVSSDYLKLIATLKNNIETDLINNKIAIWHDESHLNAYLLEKKKKILTPSYGYPEGWDLPYPPKVLILDKTKWGGHEKLRGTTNKTSYFGFFKRLFDCLLIRPHYEKRKR